MATGYSLDRELRVWRRANGSGIDYSDGDSHEEYLLEVLARASDVSSYSAELISAIRDWPSEYHLTPLRHNLLRPFTFPRGSRVLELGAGCGVMTRYLGENFAEVVSVEGSLRRARIAAERCRDLNNVAVYCDGIGDFEPGRKFDYVFVIGVLEYAPRYGSGAEPAIDFLRHAASLLEPSGTLVVAIENRLGLKYFAGCAEDHHGVPFLGVSDLYPANGATTFGRRELRELLERAGLASQHFHYPFPDYKLPSLVLTDAALKDPQLNVPDLLLTVPSRDYHFDLHRTFDEGLAWRSIHANGLVGDFANSFLVFARNQEAGVRTPDWLCRLYNRTPRAREVAVETTIDRSGPDGTMAVRKRLLHPEGAARGMPGSRIAHVASDAPYIGGSLLLNAIRETMAIEARFEVVADAFAPWLTILRANSAPDEAGSPSLPGSFVDCVPFNLIRESGSGEVRYFDDEWRFERRIPLSWVFIRGAIYSINGALSNGQLATMSHRSFVKRLAAHHGVMLRNEDFVEAARLESSFSARTTATRIPSVDLMQVYDDALYLRRRFGRTVGADEAERVKSTVSWRVTAPLRVAWNSWIRIRTLLRAGRGKQQ